MHLSDNGLLSNHVERQSAFAPTRERFGIQFEVWDHLDEYLSRLTQAMDVASQLRATLHVLRGTIEADVVFLYSTQAQKVQQVSGAPEDSLPGYTRLAHKLLARIEDSD